MKRNVIFAEIISLLYVCLMLYTAISKLMDYQLTREQMAMMPLLKPVAGTVIWLLPLVEIIIAILLFLPKARLRGLKIVTALMVAFSLYIIYMIAFHNDLPCSCGGFLEMLSWSGHLVFNGVFIVLGLVAIFFLRRSKTHDQHTELAVAS